MDILTHKVAKEPKSCPPASARGAAANGFQATSGRHHKSARGGRHHKSDVEGAAPGSQDPGAVSAVKSSSSRGVSRSERKGSSGKGSSGKGSGKSSSGKGSIGKGFTGGKGGGKGTSGKGSSGKGNPDRHDHRALEGSPSADANAAFNAADASGARPQSVSSDVGSEVGIEEYNKNLIGISREFHTNCMYF
jgi:hypothetical protein